jgi:hypothetical protein
MWSESGQSFAMTPSIKDIATIFETAQQHAYKKNKQQTPDPAKIPQ